MRRIAPLILIALLAFPALAAAESFPVTTAAGSGPGSLRKAIEGANLHAGTDTIGIGVTGAIELEEELPAISGDVTIRGPGADRLTVRRKAGAGEFRVFRIVCCPEVTISGMAIANGLADRGAGIESNAVLTLERVAVIGNEAVVSAPGETDVASEGGGILSFGSLLLRESTVSGNRAVAEDGVIATSASDAGIAALNPTLIERSTVAGNVAEATSDSGEVTAQGGGLGLSGESTAVRSSTVSGNGVTAGGEASTVARGANLLAAPGVAVRDTIVSSPHGSPSCSRPVTSEGFNLDDGASCGFFLATDLSATDPRLSAGLAANGGPTLTLALEPNSPAIDHGNAFGIAVDQRGMRRPVDFGAIPDVPGGDSSDIGAYELQDEVAPTARIETGPLPRSRKVWAKFTFSSSEPGSHFECRLDRGSSFPCSSPYNRRVRRGRSHLFEVEAVDAAGNRSVPAWRSWRVMRKRRHHRHRHHHHHRERRRSPWVT